MAMAAMLTTGVFAKRTTPDVGGKIVDEKGAPMPFVSVVLLSMPDSAFVQGAVSDENGNFKIVTPENQGVLKISSIGYQTLFIHVSSDGSMAGGPVCDRLHNMRTLESQPANKQYKIAGETLYIYAPLANRLGLNKIKSELENLSFRFEHPDEYAAIEAKLRSTSASRDELFEQFTLPIEESLRHMGIQYEIKERVKSPYSIWNKMQNKHVTFEEIYDILAVRIIFTPRVREEEVNECFNIYVAISKIYKSHPDRLRDWQISYFY